MSVCYNKDELCSSSESPVYSFMKTESPSIPPTTTPPPPCKCTVSDCVCLFMAFCFLLTAPLVNVVVGVGVIIVTVVLLIVCLLVAYVFKKHRHRKNSPGEDYCCSATTVLYSLLSFYTVPIDCTYQKRMTTENRFVLNPLTGTNLSAN